MAPSAVDLIVGIVTGFVVLAVWSGIQLFRPAKSPSA
jgi:hypothetical protein